MNIDAQAQEYRPETKSIAQFRFVAVGDLEYRAPEYIIGELIETDTLGLIFGDPGCGKSFLAVDMAMAMAVATGTPFHGRETRQGSVFFIAGEGHNGLARRFAAWSQTRGLSLEGVPLFKSEKAAQFLDGDSVAAVVKSVEQMADQFGQPSLVVIDTLARNFGLGDENSTHDMNQFICAVDALRANFPGCAIVIVHHSGHADKQRARGAMALKGALDFEYRAEKDGSTLKLVNTKMKDAEPPKDLFFNFKQVDLEGNTTSAVLEAADAPEHQRKMTKTQQTAMDAYITAAASHGVLDGGAFRGVHSKNWRQEFYVKHTGGTDDAKKKAFQRAKAWLVQQGLMMVENEVYLTKMPDIQTTVLTMRDNRDKPGHLENVPV